MRRTFVIAWPEERRHVADMFGNYIVEDQLADGGIGRVYRGRHRLLERRVAIKVLHERYAEDAQFRERFQREARAMAALDHPHIVRLLDFGEERGRFYLVMELVEGGSVRTLLDDAEGAPLDLRLAVELARQAAAGLAYAHAFGMVHRDVKPGNLLLDFSGDQGAVGGRSLKITDFGLVRLSDAATVTAAGVTLGTAAYMSPEQCAGGEIDQRSDIYSLGVVLFELLTGRLPFEAGSAPEIAEKHVREAAPAPKEFVPELPEALNSITLRCLAKSPVSRYQSCDELLNELTTLAATEREPTRQLGVVAAADRGTAVERPPAKERPEATDADGRARSEGGADSAVKVVLEPRETTGRVVGRYRVRIVGDGGRTARLALTLDYSGARLWSRLKPETLVLTPGGEANAHLTLVAPPRFGTETAAHAFEVHAESVIGLRGAAAGTFKQPPLAFGWMPFAAGGALVALLACLLLGAVVAAITGARPFGIGAEAGEALYVVDGGGRIQRFDRSGDPLGGLNGAEDTSTVAAVAIDDDGNVYIADGGGNRILRLDEDGEVLAQWGAAGSAPGQFDGPSDIAIAPGGSIYVVDRGNDRIQVFDPAGGFVAQYGERGSGPGRFNHPAAIAFDNVGNFYVVDTGNDRIQKLQSFGAFLLEWGGSGTEPGRFSAPSGVAVDRDGNVYVADAGNARIQKFDFDGRFITAWGAGDEGSPALARPTAVAIYRERVYVADEAAGRVLVFSLDGEFQRSWPDADVDGGQFDAPREIAVAP